MVLGIHIRVLFRFIQWSETNSWFRPAIGGACQRGAMLIKEPLPWRCQTYTGVFFLLGIGPGVSVNRCLIEKGSHSSVSWKKKEKIKRFKMNELPLYFISHLYEVMTARDTRVYCSPTYSPEQSRHKSNRPWHGSLRPCPLPCHGSRKAIWVSFTSPSN